MEESVFSYMISWVQANQEGTAEFFFTEIEYYMRIHNQEEDFRKQLKDMIMRNDTIDELFHKMFRLWELVLIPERERVKQFIGTLKPSISISLRNKPFINVREALEKARNTETMAKIINKKYPRIPKTNNPKNPPQNRNNKPNTNNSNTGNTNINSGFSGNHPNDKFTPCVKKPSGWTGTWYDPEKYPKKLDQDTRIELTKQGRCWGCRGSEHKAGDEVNEKQICPRRDEKWVNTQHVLAITETGHASDEEEKI